MGDIIMDNLLKEAIADAKAVRETALQNAKIALEEAFTPKIQSMLSQKIQLIYRYYQYQLALDLASSMPESPPDFQLNSSPNC